MTEPEGITLEGFRTIVKRAGLSLTEGELESLKPMYEHYVRECARLHELDMDAEDLAVAFSPKWDPQS